jgi:hypothetical protein
MCKRLLLFSFTLFVAVLAYGQNPYVKAELYLSNGEVLKGEVDSTFARKSNIKIFFDDNSSEQVNRSQLDSIQCNGKRYVIYRNKKEVRLLQVIDEGKVDLFQMNGRQLALKRDDTKLNIVFYKNYSRAYNVFYQDSSMVPVGKMSRTEFINKVKSKNDTLALSNYDWMKSYAKPLIFRLSVLMPSAGVEVKISNKFSFYTGMAINLFGDDVRGAKTFLNYNYNAELRYFFMPLKRLEKGKYSYNFTGPYFGATYNYLIDSGIENASIGGVVFGWQESNLITNTFQLVKIGLGSDFNTGEVYLIGGVSMGWYF